MAINDGTGAAEWVVGIGPAKRGIDLFVHDHHRTENMLAAASQQKGRVLELIAAKIEKDMRKKIADMSDAIRALMESLQERVFDFIVDHNFDKLMKADAVIERFIERIYPRQLVDLLASHNKANFKEELFDRETGERLGGSPAPTPDYERI